MEATNDYYNYNNINATFADAMYTNENAGKDDVGGPSAASQQSTKVSLKAPFVRQTALLSLL